jgi:hypothetical protein
VTPATPNSSNTPNPSVAQTLPIPVENKENKSVETKATEGDLHHGNLVNTADPLAAAVKTADKPIAATTTASNEKTLTTEKTPTTAAVSSSKPTTSAARPLAKTGPKKKKRSGLSGFLLKLGCLSADEFEDPEPKKGTAASKATPVKPATATSSKPAEKAVGTEAKQASAAPASGHAGLVGASAATTGVTLVGAAVAGEKGLIGEGKKGDEVVVAPQEPTTLPDDEVNLTSYVARNVLTGRLLDSPLLRSRLLDLARSSSRLVVGNLILHPALPVPMPSVPKRLADTPTSRNPRFPTSRAEQRLPV